MSVFRRSRGLGLIALWAFAPPMVVQQDTITGRMRVSVGTATGRYASVQRSCDGSLLSAELVPYRATGVHAEMWPLEELRLSAWGGGSAVDGDALSPGDRSTAFFGAQLAYEGRSIGLGLGGARMFDYDLPSAYVRVGPTEATHLRMDVAPPTTMPGVTGMVRVGPGFALGDSRWFAGLQGGRPFEDAEGGGPFVEGAIPLPPGFDLLLTGSVYPGSGGVPTDWGAGVGLRFSPGG